MASHTPYDKKLLEQIAGGDEQSFAQVFTPFLNVLEGSLMRMIKDRNITHDILQETMLKCWLNRRKLPQVLELKGWVYRIAVNEFHQFIRKEAAEMRRRRVLGKENVMERCNDSTETLEIAEVVSQAVGDLSPQRRKVYRLSREEGLTIPEIAKELKLSSSTVKHTLIAALNGVREYLKKEGYTFLFALIIFH